MAHEIVIFRALCETQTFIINGKEADWRDFGTKEDEDWENAEDYCCGYMKFRMKSPTTEILEKYGIDEDEYYEICEELDGLSFGSCGWCS
jgi:hypothetical protein